MNEPTDRPEGHPAPHPLQPVTPSLQDDLRAVHADDALLDLIAGRQALGDGDDAVLLLQALAVDVDRELPVGIDLLAIQALAARFGGPDDESAELDRTSRMEATDDAGPAPRAKRRAVLRLTTGGAVAAGLMLICGSAGLAAAVSGDPAGAFGLRSLSAIVKGEPAKAPESVVQRLQQRIEVAEQGPVDTVVVERLRAEAARLPDGGGKQVQLSLAALEAKARAFTPPTVPSHAPTTGPSSTGGPGDGDPTATLSGTRAPTETGTGTGQPSSTGSGLASPSTTAPTGSGTAGPGQGTADPQRTGVSVPGAPSAPAVVPPGR